MKVLFDPLAVLEVKDAAEYYELEVLGLGARFRFEIRGAIERIRGNPYLWAKEKGNVRKYLLHRFPYKILYSIEIDYLYIVAVAHGHRRPEYWIDRIG